MGLAIVVIGFQKNETISKQLLFYKKAKRI